MNFMEALKNLYSYLFLGRCRRHDRELSEVQVRGHYASTMPICVECHPQYRGRELKDPSQSVVAAPEFSEVEVG
ncbi:MAG: hypothetical protein ACM3JB_03865 [Acidobacteriaceae bacterium]